MRTLKVVFGMLLVAAAATAADGTVSQLLVGSPRQVGVVKVEPMTIDAVPQHMNLQGYLTDASGNPINGDQTMRFDIYRGSSVWNETQEVGVENGLFCVILGDVTPIPYSVFDPGTTCELGLTVEGQALSPRVEITSVGYAYRCLKSDTAVYALASAGADNAWVRSGSDSVLYTVNKLGIAKGGASNKLHGTQAFTHVNFGTACTTGTSGLNRAYATVGGGSGNCASGTSATVGGGLGNCASGNSATVAGGYGSSATQDYATVAGGYYNFAAGIRSTVGGGYCDSATGMGSVVAGGEQCRATGGNSAVGGGSDNLASGGHSVVSGGSNNVAGGLYSAIVGGAFDSVMGSYSAAFGRSCYIYAADTAIVFFDSLTHGVLRVNIDGRQNHAPFSASPIFVGTSTHNGNGAYLTAGGVWTDGSLDGRSFKSAPVDAGQLLAKVKSLDVVRLTNGENSETHITPTVDHFCSMFKCGTQRVDGAVEGRGGIAALDVAGVSLAAVQELVHQLEAQQARIAELEARLARLEQR